MFFTSLCAYRAPMVARAVQKMLKIYKKTAIFFFKNRVGSTARPSGRVVGQSYARFKAEIELHNIRTTAKHESQPSAANFEFLCPAVRTSPPSNQPNRASH